MQDSKQIPPTVVVPEAMTGEEKRSKKSLLLTSWASVATALVLILLIGGAFYVADLKNRECDEHGNESAKQDTKDYSRTFKNGEETEKENFHVDNTEQTELIVKKSENGDISMITVMDYKRKLSASYIPAKDQCVLLAGINMDWTDDMETEKNKTIVLDNKDYREEDYKVSGNKVTDLSILPKALRTYCKGTPTYWLHPENSNGQRESDTETGLSRDKRRIVFRYCYYYCWRIGSWCYYSRRCYYW